MSLTVNRLLFFYTFSFTKTRLSFSYTFSIHFHSRKHGICLKKRSRKIRCKKRFERNISSCVTFLKLFHIYLFSHRLPPFFIGVDRYVHLIYTHCCFSTSFWCPNVYVCCHCSLIFLNWLGSHSSTTWNRQCKFHVCILHCM